MPYNWSVIISHRLRQLLQIISQCEFCVKQFFLKLVYHVFLNSLNASGYWHCLDKILFATKTLKACGFVGAGVAPPLLEPHNPHQCVFVFAVVKRMRSNCKVQHNLYTKEVVQQPSIFRYTRVLPTVYCVTWFEAFKIRAMCWIDIVLLLFLVLAIL